MVRSYAVWALIKLDGKEYIGEKELKDAIVELDTMMKWGENTTSYIERADIKNYLGDTKGAIADWEKVIELDPSRKSELQPMIDEAKKKLEK